MRRRFINSAKQSTYLTIEALEDGLMVSFDRDGLKYCIDNNNVWKELEAGTFTIAVNTGQTISFKGKLRQNKITAGNLLVGVGIFSITKKCNLLGCCTSILFDDNDLEYAFCNLFKDNTSIISIEKNFLPATTLANYCYRNMFYGCTGLTHAPELPATTLATGCYEYMFYGCTSLTQAPKLPATTLANYCYDSMFLGCTNLSYIKMLATDISASDSLYSWVKNVSSSGTFVKSKDATWDTTPNALRDSGVPAGWAVITEEEESNPLNVILNINANNGEEGVRVYNYILEKTPWISSAFDNLFIEGLYEGSMLSAKVVGARFMGNTLILSYEGQGHYDMCSLSSDGYLELVFND